jgi:hypothetical protein
VLRWLLVLLVLASCGRGPATPSKPVGYSPETAITIELVADPRDLAPHTQSAVVASPGVTPTHYYRVTLHEPSHIGATVLDNRGSPFRVVLSTATGTIQQNDVATGVVEISVSGPTEPYRLHVHAMPEVK